MTVAAQVPIGGQTANGVTTVFPFGYRILSADDLIILADGVEVTSGFTLSGVGDASGGTITFTTAPANGVRIVHYRSSVLRRTSDYQDNGDLLAPSFNADFDGLWMVLQEIVSGTAGASSAVRAPAGETLDAMPAAAARLGKLLYFDETTGDPLASSFTHTQVASAVAAAYAAGSTADAVTYLGAFIGAVAMSVQEKLRGDAVSPMDADAAGDEATDDKTALHAVLRSGLLVDGGERVYAVNGSLTVDASLGHLFGNIRRLRLLQLDPTVSNCKTLTIKGFAGAVISGLEIDRGGEDGYTVGTLEDYNGLRLEDCPDATVVNSWVTNGGRGTALMARNCDRIRIICRVDEHYWQEVNPASPVITDDIIQPVWCDNCEGVLLIGSTIRNITTGVAGNAATGVDATQVRKHTRMAFGGCSRVKILGNDISHISQAIDMTGSLGNTDVVIALNTIEDAGNVAIKGANSLASATIALNTIRRPGKYGILLSGKTEVSNPDPRDIAVFMNRIHDVGASGDYSASIRVGISVEATGTSPTMPRGVRIFGNEIVDTQGTPTTEYAIRNNWTAIGPTTTGYNRPFSVRAWENVVSVPGMPAANYFEGVHHAYAILRGDGGSSDTLADDTWVTLGLDGTELADPSGLHSTTTNADTLTFKESGLYQVKAGTTFPANATGVRRVRILLDGSTPPGGETPSWPAHPTGATPVEGVFIVLAVTNQTLQLQGRQNSGGSQNVTRSFNVLEAVKVG